MIIAPTLRFPAISFRTFATMLLAGAAAMVAFDLFGQALAPISGYAQLVPAPLAGGNPFLGWGGIA